MSDATSGESNSDSDFSDYVSSPDEESTEIDSDVPLSVYAKRRRESSAAFSAPFQWQEEDSTPMKCGLSVNGGAVDRRLNRSSTCSKTF